MIDITKVTGITDLIQRKFTEEEIREIIYELRIYLKMMDEGY